MPYIKGLRTISYYSLAQTHSGLSDTDPRGICHRFSLFLEQKQNKILYTDKKEKKIFLIHREIQMGSGAKSYEEGLPIVYEEMHKYFHNI